MQRQIMASQLGDSVRLIDYILLHADTLSAQQRTQLQNAAQTLHSLQLALWNLDPRRTQTSGTPR